MKIIYILFRGFTWTINLLPFRAVYCISDLLRFFLYYVARYRRNVVLRNMQLSFPGKSEAEIRKLAWRYYRNLTDIFLEMIRVESISREEMERRLTVKNYHLITDRIASKRSIIAVTGHLGNWEWLGVRWTLFSGYRSFAIVKPLTNPYFHRYLNGLRIKFAEEGLIDHRNAFREMVRMRNETCMTLILADQTPTRDEINYWTTFLNQETPVFLGTEKIAKSLDQSVLFFALHRIKRGYYELDIRLITDTPKETAEFWITETHVRMLEQEINKHPDDWLWSHRRWKHKKSNI